MAGQAEDSSLPESDSSDSDTPHLLPLQATTPANAQKPKKSAKSKGKKRGKGKGKTTVESSESPRHSRKHINDSDDEVERALREVNAECVFPVYFGIESQCESPSTPNPTHAPLQIWSLVGTSQ